MEMSICHDALRIAVKRKFAMMDKATWCAVAATCKQGIVATCGLLQSSVKSIKKKEHLKKQKQLAGELEVAWQSRQFRDFWVIPRRIPGGRFGPKRRMLKNPRILPSAQDVMEKF